MQSFSGWDRCNARGDADSTKMQIGGVALLEYTCLVGCNFKARRVSQSCLYELSPTKSPCQIVQYYKRPVQRQEKCHHIYLKVS